MNVLVSACLLGENCKYNGKNNYNPKVVEFLSDKNVIKICPEVLGGLGTPSNCSEIVNGTVMDNKGNNIDAEFKKGITAALEKIKDEDIDLVILQSRSPTCGVHQIYDGTFSGKLIDGQGLFAKELIKRGYKVMDAEEFK